MIDLDIDEAHRAVGEWAEENFGAEQPAHFPLLGAGEEMGELSTSILKRAQGIDDSEKYRDRVGDEAEMDAIGDVFIYLMDFSYRYGLDMDVVEEYLHGAEPMQVDEIEKAAEDIDLRPAVMMAMFGVYSRYNSLSEHAYMRPLSDMGDPERKLGELIEFLVLICDIRGFSFEQAVHDTMDEVLDREWDAEIQV